MHLWLVIYVNAFMPLCIALAISAWRWGGALERRASFAFLASMTAAKIIRSPQASLYASIEWGTAAADLLLLAAFLRWSLRHPRQWLLAATALQLLSTLSHLARLINGGMSPLVYAILTGSGGYPILILLAAGIVVRARQRAKMRLPAVDA